MEHIDKSVLCRNRVGEITALNPGVAYELTFKNVYLLLTASQIHQLKDELELLNEQDWFLGSAEAFTLLQLPLMDFSTWVTQSELEQLMQLLLEAVAMMKVHHWLAFRTERSRTN
ncbi:hypothetical protein [Tunicatimonas pelagia]|uniref:hypothetical protein n=1 Tax=Tunicatimonas pelagia TaxID=931531 RepID=UPI002666C726|nr:hypothetical protein [Tunicatimonas pelagia]WKN41415.1 hypothetical protein P0M28_20475 [Tunicatimonas pelagia]